MWSVLGETPFCLSGQKLIFQKEEELANSLKEKNQSEEGQKEKLRKEALGKRQERLEKEAHVGNAAFVMGHRLSWDMGWGSLALREAHPSAPGSRAG